MYEKELQEAILAAKAAGNYLKNNIEQTKIEKEEGKDIKLSADRKSEEIIIDILQKTEIPILSEEIGFIGNEREKFWIIDPLDGSANYIRGLYNLTCVSIALWDNNKPMLGVIYRWYTDDIYFGIKGISSKKNGKTLQPSNIISVNNAYLATGFPVRRDYSTESLSKFICLVQKFKKIRMFGTAALSGVMVSEGLVDTYIEDEIMIWDVAAACAIVEASGGCFILKLLNEYKCNCSIFANSELMEDYYAQGL